MDTVKVTISTTFTLPASQAKYLTDNFCEAYHYQADLPLPGDLSKTTPNPESKDAFMQRIVGEFIKNTAISNVIGKASAAAAAQAKSEGDGTIVPDAAVAQVDPVVLIKS